MFVLTRNVSASQKAIATLLATAVVLWTLGYYTTAQAANVTNFSDTLSDSAPGANATHTISFTTPTGVANTETMTFSFPAGFTGIASIVDSDVTIEDDTVDISANVTATGAGQDLQLTLDTGTIVAGSVVDIVIGSTNFIANPATPVGGNESFEIDLAGTMTDSGHTRVVILDTVLVTATVNTTFDFTVYGNGTAEAVNGTTTTITTGSTTIPFGVLTAGQIETGSQDLTVQTNAANGFVVTVETDGEFRSSTGAEIDGFQDNSDTNTPGSWAAPTENVNDSTTWGHWGITSEDTNTNGVRTTDFASDQWIAATTSPRVVFAHNGPADASTAGIGSTTVGFQVEITPLQEAGDDYQTTLTYIATPTF